MSYLANKPGTGPGGIQVNGENLTSQGPGSVFTLAHTPIAGTLKLYRGGARQLEGTDYSVAGAIITLVVPLAGGEILLADYNY